MNNFIRKVRSRTARIEPWWSFVLVPIWQEYIFRYLPYTLLYTDPKLYWVFAFGTAFAFASIHWYLGKWFVLYSFVGGLALWWVMVNFGLLAAIIVHAFVNVVDFSTGFRRLLMHNE